MEIKNLLALVAALIVFVLLLLAAQWFSGGLSENDEESGGGSLFTEPVELSVWLWEDDLPISSQIYEDFQRVYPGITLDVHVYPVRDYPEKLSAALAAGESADVFNVNKAECLSTMIEEGRLLPLEDLISERKFDTSIYSTQYDGIKYKGVAYALPYRLSVFCIAYNKSLFRERGVPFLDDRMTWEELADRARQMTYEQDGEKVYGLYLINRTFDQYFMAFQDGRTLVDDNLKPFAESLEYKRELIESGVCIPPADYDGLFIRREFEQEHFAMYLTADWTINQMRESYVNGDIRFEFDVAMLPSTDGKSYGHSFGQQTFTGINAGCENPEAAFTFITHYAGMPGAKRFAEGGLLPAVIGDDEIMELFIGDGTQAPGNISAFVEQTTYLMMPVLPGIEQLNDLFLREAVSVCGGDKTVGEAMLSIEEQRREIMKNYD